MGVDKSDPEYDEHCDPDNPSTIKYDDIVAAGGRISGQIPPTPCMIANMSGALGMELYIKQEFLQFTGCFKERGLCNLLLLLSDEERKQGVITASSGNHGAALSYLATKMNIPYIIVMPLYSSITKVTKCQKYGGKILMHGQDMAEAKRFAMTLAKEKKLYYINGYDHPNVIEGQGTIGLEILQQIPDVDAILVPVGGGSLCCGIAIAVKKLKPDCEIYGIETDKTASMSESLKQNQVVTVKICSTIADGLAACTVGYNTFHNLKGLLNRMVVVKEDWVARAIMYIVDSEKFVVEGAGAVGVAAIMAGLFPNLKNKKVVCICSGGNIDTTTLARALERGMALEGRLLKFKVTVVDRPGGMSELCSLLATVGVPIRDCVPERAWIKGDVFSCDLKVICETKGWDHTKEVIDTIKKHYEECYFPEMPDKAETAGSRRGPCLAPNPLCMQR